MWDIDAGNHTQYFYKSIERLGVKSVLRKQNEIQVLMCVNTKSDFGRWVLDTAVVMESILISTCICVSGWLPIPLDYIQILMWN